MWPYIVRRVLSGLVMLFAVTLMTFAVFRLVPFTPASSSFTSNGVRRAKSAESRDITNKPAPHEITQPPSTRWAGVAATCTETSVRILNLNEAVTEACLPLADLRATTLAAALWPDEPHAQSARTQAPSMAA